MTEEERLQGFLSAVADVGKELASRDAEIERLTSGVNRAAGLYGRTLADLTMAKELITELADKLDKLRSSFDFISESTWEAHDVPELIQRAREAVNGK